MKLILSGVKLVCEQNFPSPRLVVYDLPRVASRTNGCMAFPSLLTARNETQTTFSASELGSTTPFPKRYTQNGLSTSCVFSL